MKRYIDTTLVFASAYISMTREQLNFLYNPLFSASYDFRLAFSGGNEFTLRGKTAKRKAEEFLLQPKKSVRV
jgi:hypothetical protein